MRISKDEITGGNAATVPDGSHCSAQRRPDARQGVRTALTAPLGAAYALRLQAAVLSQTRFAEAGTALAQELASALRCERVSIGWLARDHAEVAALSYGSEPLARKELGRLVAAAMDESIEQSASLTFPPRESEKPRIRLAHAELARRHGCALCTVPLAVSGKTLGAITLERTEVEFTAVETASLEHLACLLAPLLQLKRDAERTLRTHFLASLRALTDRLFTKASHPKKLVVLGIATTLVLLAAVPLNYRVSAPARLEGTIQRVLVAPADGFLHQAHVRPGDKVKVGQLLAELADQDLLLESRKWSAELAQYENAYSAALARADRTNLVINQARAAEARAKLDLVAEQLARTRIQAPFDGVVITGDLSQSLGAPVQRGSSLFTLAPVGGYRVIVEVDERDIALIREGQRGALTLAALPSQTFALQVERVTPLADTVEGRHFFEVRATLEGDAQALRPGLQGVAKIDIDRRPLLLAWTTRAWHSLRLALWSWGV